MMHEFRADLHCHSTCSDGTLTPSELIALAKELNLSALSITDHDTLQAYGTVIPIAEKAGVILLNGIEFSAYQNDKSVHILGYGFDLNCKALHDLCAWHIERRKTRNQDMLKSLAKHGIILEYADLEVSERTIGRPHIASLIVQKGYAANMQEAFNKFLGDGKPCFVRGATVSVDDTIRTLHEAKGVAVLAHPHLIKDVNLINALLKKEFDGIECYYGKLHANTHQHWLKAAKRQGWLVTGGSDFHGERKPDITLGCSFVGQDHFQAILERIHILHGM